MAIRNLHGPITRGVDVALSSVGLVVFSPLLALLAVLVALESGPPVFYRGLRVGRGGKLFKIVKFRTMVPDADKLGSSVTRESDDRITGLGRFLRRTKLDELPQLWNVVKGEMSLVGPRPDAPEIVNTYSEEMRRALDARPGITSLASLWLRNESELLRGLPNPDEVYQKVVVPEKVQLAIAHLDRRSFRFDWGVLLATVAAWFGFHSESAAERRFLSKLRARIDAFRAGEESNSGLPEDERRPPAGPRIATRRAKK